MPGGNAPACRGCTLSCVIPFVIFVLGGVCPVVLGQRGRVARLKGCQAETPLQHRDDRVRSLYLPGKPSCGDIDLGVGDRLAHALPAFGVSITGTLNISLPHSAMRSTSP